jgi:hypothetical protein
MFQRTSFSRGRGADGAAITSLVAEAFRLESDGSGTELGRVEGELEAAVHRLYDLSEQDVTIIDRELLGRI